MNREHVCTNCQAPLPIEAPLGLCLTCRTRLEANSTSFPDDPTVLELDSSAPIVELRPAVEFDPRPGLACGKYQIFQMLGEGGMGTVYEAEDAESGRRVALKVLRQAVDTPEARKRFLLEGRLAASVSHPNLVYIFGTDEIGGNLVIVMELVRGGTLKGRVARAGPLPVLEAVDFCIQMIAGLEVAAAAGVLHRDIKPSNCFIDPDDTVKIGDFGLSISTLARTDSQLTASGCFLGTPAYASPEQIRGDNLDLRSDIYSVGVTLYFLLTGKTPFEGDNVAKLLATVLEKAPESPAKLRGDIPRALASLVLRCLSKKPEQRFKDYAELRTALRPFATGQEAPAPLNLRGGAGVIDALAISALSTAVLSAAGKEPAIFAFPGQNGAQPSDLVSSIAVVSALCPILAQIGYYALTEGLWSATPGKASCKLRLVDLEGQSAGLRQAFVRALIFVGLPSIPPLIVQLTLLLDIGKTHAFGMLSGGTFAGLLFFGLLFSPARKRNGFAGFHDLLSRTRVIKSSSTSAARPIQARSEVAPMAELPERIGPYQAAESLERTRDYDFVLGYDAQLLRQLWIRKMPRGAPPVRVERQNVSRTARIRWITSRRSTRENWDAYEASSGKVLLNPSGARAAWSEVRCWLLDLAEEIRDASRTQTLPEAFALDRVWICADGRAKLLDFPAPNFVAGRAQSNFSGAAVPLPEDNLPPEVDASRGQTFLQQIALTALEGGGALPITDTSRSASVPIPLHARQFLDELPRTADWEKITHRLTELLSLPASVTGGTRAKMLVVLGLPWLIIWVLLAIAAVVESAQRLDPRMVLLKRCLTRITELQPRVQELDAARSGQLRNLEIYVASAFPREIQDLTKPDRARREPYLSGYERTIAQRILRTRPSPPPEEVREATMLLHSDLARWRQEASSQTRSSLGDLTFGAVVIWLTMVGVPSFLCALLFRGGYVTYRAGVTFVTRDGSPASRWRLCARTLITWIPAVLILLMVRRLNWTLTPAFAGLISILYIYGLVRCLVTPDRSLVDHLAGTWMVPR